MKLKVPVSSLEKRIKRHVIARERTFFATTIPGFEGLLGRELSNLQSPAGERTPLEGGVEFKGRLQACYEANLKLRTAHRILMRIGSFRVTNFRALQKKIEGLPWELYLPPGRSPEIRVTSKHSRLYHTVALEGCIRKGINTRFAPEATHHDPASLGESPIIFARVQEDLFSLSIDSSGDLLHRRGIKPHPAKAPIRETIAAAALLFAGYDGKRPLLDPMCGSGTFSLEAAMIARNIPPGWFRNFAFMTWPAFRPPQWAYLRKEAEKGLIPLPEFPPILASDIDARSCEILETALRDSGLNGLVRVSRADFFDLSPHDVAGGPGILAINPPYGRRLGTQIESDRLFREICIKMKKDFRGWDVALIAPGRHLLDNMPFHLHIRPILHGGLRPFLLTGMVS